jgi:hypothetical protein
LTDVERLEEAHGLWELAVARVAALTEAAIYEPEGGGGAVGQGLPVEVLREAVVEERAAFHHWSSLAEALTKPPG